MTVYNSAGDSEGTSFGQSGEKIGFFGTTPVTQQSNIADATASVTTTAFNQLLTALENYGLLASS